MPETIFSFGVRGRTYDMGFSFMYFLLVCIFQCFFVPLVASQGQLAPALFIFGDSFFDSGNNNNRKTLAKANYPPYGIDFPSGVTGRFSNGLIITDYFALSLGLQISPPFLETEESVMKNFLEGFNYASASAGILPETGSALGGNLCMTKQVKLFRKTVRDYIPLHFTSSNELSNHLSKSIFAILIGGNDYANNYLQPQQYNSSSLYNPKQFGELLVKELGNHLKELYYLGARKFVVFEIAAIGCFPAILNKVKPKTRCVEDTNKLVSIFNKKLANELNLLSTILEGSTFTKAESYRLTYNMLKHPARYGLNETRNPCCMVGDNGTGPCIPNKRPCQDRDSHLFWDSFHPTQAVHKAIGSQCFNATGLCTPFNILQLTQKS
ncbi:GDSL esterase/lipase 7 [Vitis vinifera]|nr:GDSL esterase/lipase 7 [Vitis vinifera]|eukprot:XP_010654133.2 PREDICTED: GDSL esterase/lipase 7 [Vitis vinifera]